MPIGRNVHFVHPEHLLPIIDEYNDKRYKPNVQKLSWFFSECKKKKKKSVSVFRNHGNINWMDVPHQVYRSAHSYWQASVLLIYVDVVHLILTYPVVQQ